MFIKLDKSVVFLIICTIPFIPYSALSMKDNSLIPYVQFNTQGRSAVAIKENTFALMEGKCVRIWNLDGLSPGHRIPIDEYNCSPTSDATYRFMDLNHNGTQLLLHSSCLLMPSNRISICHLLKKRCFCFIDAEKIEKDMFSAPSNSIKVAKIFDYNTAITADYEAIYVWQQGQKQSTNIPMPIIYDIPVSYLYKAPIVAVHEATKSFAYFLEPTGSDRFPTGFKDNKQYFFTNHNYRHYYRHFGFIFLLLKQLKIPMDVVAKIVLAIEPLPIQQINIDLPDDTIFSMEYSPDGLTLVLMGQKNIYICKLQEADISNKNCITKMPIAGFLTFYPNNKTLFVMDDTGKTILGIDLKTKKIIYEHKLTDKLIIAPIVGEENKLLAFNKKGDKLAVAFYKHCQIYDLPESLQDFLNTYDPETVSEIVLEPEKKVVDPIKKHNKQQKQDKQAENCVVQ